MKSPLQARRRMKSLIQTVKVVCGVTIKMRGTEPQSVTAFFIQTTNSMGRVEGHHLFFDKWQFSKERAVSIPAPCTLQGREDILPSDLIFKFRIPGCIMENYGIK